MKEAARTTGRKVANFVGSHDTVLLSWHRSLSPNIFLVIGM